MAQAFKIEISSPATKSGGAKVWTFSPSTGDVQSIDLDLKKEHHRISLLTVKLHDPKWEIFSALPDIAFANVPIKLWLAPPGAPRSPTVLVFEGKITSLQPSFPGPESLTIVAHDKSIDARRDARYRTFRNKTSVQIAQAIAADYGYAVSVEDLGDVQLVVRTIDIGMPGSTGNATLSDWDHLGRALAGDGLEVVMEGATLRIRQSASKAYPVKFTRGQPPVVSLSPSVNHVHGPGAGGDTKTPVNLENAGTKQALLAAKAQEAAAAKAEQRTHRHPIAGAKSADVASIEDVPTGWTNQATNLRRRKDTATLTLTLTPDLYLTHLVQLDGWGAKVDGEWHIETLKHHIVGDTYGATTVSLHRGPSKSATNQVGVAYGGA